MKNKIYIVCRVYHPNTAFTNRVLSFIHGFSEFGVAAEVVYLVPDIDRNKVQEQYPNIMFRYMWENQIFFNRVVNKIAEWYYGWKFARSLKP